MTKLEKRHIEVMKMLKVIEKKKIIVDIHYCKAGVGILFYYPNASIINYTSTYKDKVWVDKYYPTFSACIKAEYQKLIKGE